MILPLECFARGLGNTCGTGRVRRRRPGHARVALLREARPGRDPEGDVGRDLARRQAHLDEQRQRPARLPHERRAPANAAPAGPDPAVRRLRGAVPPIGHHRSGVRQRQAVPRRRGHRYQIWSVNTKTGGRRLEFETEMCGEAEGLDTIPTLGGRLHWLLSPIDDCELTYAPTSALVHFVRRPGKPRLKVRILGARLLSLPGRRRVRVQVTPAGQAGARCARGFAGAGGRAPARGVHHRLARARRVPGRYKALARARQWLRALSGSCRSASTDHAAIGWARMLPRAAPS